MGGTTSTINEFTKNVTNTFLSSVQESNQSNDNDQTVTQEIEFNCNATQQTVIEVLQNDYSADELPNILAFLIEVIDKTCGGSASNVTRQEIVMNESQFEKMINTLETDQDETLTSKLSNAIDTVQPGFMDSVFGRSQDVTSAISVAVSAVQEQLQEEGNKCKNIFTASQSIIVNSDNSGNIFQRQAFDIITNTIMENESYTTQIANIYNDVSNHVKDKQRSMIVAIVGAVLALLGVYFVFRFFRGRRLANSKTTYINVDASEKSEKNSRAAPPKKKKKTKSETIEMTDL